MERDREKEITFSFFSPIDKFSDASQVREEDDAKHFSSFRCISSSSSIQWSNWKGRKDNTSSILPTGNSNHPSLRAKHSVQPPPVPFSIRWEYFSVFPNFESSWMSDEINEKNDCWNISSQKWNSVWKRVAFLIKTVSYITWRLTWCQLSISLNRTGSNFVHHSLSLTISRKVVLHSYQIEVEEGRSTMESKTKDIKVALTLDPYRLNK